MLIFTETFFPRTGYDRDSILTAVIKQGAYSAPLFHHTNHYSSYGSDRKLWRRGKQLCSTSATKYDCYFAELALRPCRRLATIHRHRYGGSKSRSHLVGERRSKRKQHSWHRPDYRNLHGHGVIHCPHQASDTQYGND